MQNIKNIFILNIPNHFKVALTAWLSRIGIAIIQIFTIRELISYLGEESYAVYAVVYSLLAWCGLADFGIGTSLQNYISESRVQNKNYNVYLKTCLQIIIILLILFTGFILLFSGYLQNFLLKNYLHITEVKTVNIIFIICCIYILLAFVNISIKILYAMQKGIIPNILQLISYIFSAVSIIVLNKYFNNRSSILLALICFSVPQVLIMFIPFIKIFKDSLSNIFTIDRQIFKNFIIRAAKFGGFAFMALAVLQIDYFIMAKTLDPVSIATYNIFSKVFIFVIFIYTSVLSAFWPVSSELFNSGNYGKLQKLLKKYSYTGIILVITGIAAVFIFKNIILQILAPNLTVNIGIKFFIIFCLYYVFRIVSDTYAMFLQSINVLKIFWIYTPIQAVISVVAQYFLSLKYGINGIVLGLALSFLLTSAWVLPYKAHKIFKSVNVKIKK